MLARELLARDRVRVGLTLPSFVEDPEIPIAVARAAEAAGLDAVFVFDHLWRGDAPNRRPALECFALLGAVAAETTTHRASARSSRARRCGPPATLANCFATAQRVSGGRLIAGIGAGDSQSRAENEAFGLDVRHDGRPRAALHDAVRAARGGDYPVWVGGRAAQVREIVRPRRRLERLGRDAHEVGARVDARARGRARTPRSRGAGWC